MVTTKTASSQKKILVLLDLERHLQKKIPVKIKLIKSKTKNVFANEFDYSSKQKKNTERHPNIERFKVRILNG